MLLEGRVAVVTGASRGIGAAIARAFAAHGAHLLLCARSEGVDEVARELSSAERPVRAVRGDVSDPGLRAGADHRGPQGARPARRAGEQRRHPAARPDRHDVGRADARAAGGERAGAHDPHPVRRPHHGSSALTQHHQPRVHRRHPGDGRGDGLLRLQGRGGGLHALHREGAGPQGHPGERHRAGLHRHRHGPRRLARLVRAADPEHPHGTHRHTRRRGRRGRLPRLRPVALRHRAR